MTECSTTKKLPKRLRETAAIDDAFCFLLINKCVCVKSSYCKPVSNKGFCGCKFCSIPRSFNCIAKNIPFISFAVYHNYQQFVLHSSKFQFSAIIQLVVKCNCKILSFASYYNVLQSCAFKLTEASSNKRISNNIFKLLIFISNLNYNSKSLLKLSFCRHYYLSGPI